MEAERDHALDRPKSADDEDAMWNPEDAMVAQANVSESASSDLLNQYEALGADAEFDGVLFDGAAWGKALRLVQSKNRNTWGFPACLMQIK